MQLPSFTQWLQNEIWSAIVWTFVHSLWQGLAAAMLVALIIFCTRRSTARLRYNLIGLTFLIFLASTVVTFCMLVSQQAPIIADNTIATETPNSGSRFAFTALTTEGFMVTISAWLNNNITLLFAIWFFVFLWKAFRLISGFAAIHRLRHQDNYVVTGKWKYRFEDLCRDLSITQPVRLLQSKLVKVPVAIGYFKPLILVPMGMLAHLPPEQVETILLHELGHVKRKDFLINFLQLIAEAIFFFNPALLWLSSLLRREREACCDDIAIKNKAHTISYMKAL